MKRIFLAVFRKKYKIFLQKILFKIWEEISGYIIWKIWRCKTFPFLHRKLYVCLCFYIVLYWNFKKVLRHFNYQLFAIKKSLLYNPTEQSIHARKWKSPKEKAFAIYYSFSYLLNAKKCFSCLNFWKFKMREMFDWEPR